MCHLDERANLLRIDRRVLLVEQAEVVACIKGDGGASMGIMGG